MSSEWLKVMLEEIARKKAEAEQDQLEFERRRAEREGAPAAGAVTVPTPGPATVAEMAAPALSGPAMPASAQ